MGGLFEDNGDDNEGGDNTDLNRELKKDFDVETLAEAFRHKLLNFRDMNWYLRLLVTIGVTNLIAVAGFKISISYLHMKFATFQLGGDSFPIPFFYYAAAILPFALSCIITAALHSHYIPRVLMLL